MGHQLPPATSNHTLTSSHNCTSHPFVNPLMLQWPPATLNLSRSAKSSEKSKQNAGNSPEACQGGQRTLVSQREPETQDRLWSMATFPTAWLRKCFCFFWWIPSIKCRTHVSHWLADSQADTLRPPGGVLPSIEGMLCDLLYMKHYIVKHLQTHPQRVNRIEVEGAPRAMQFLAIRRILSAFTQPLRCDT